jgi:hypothetical protein
MANTPTTLGNLEFSQIKNSLTDYLRNQSTFSGYNFEGSAIQTIIDLLAYNTFYYAYYANMINAEAFLDSAQKEDSIISLCKPLGYTVPARTAARATVTVNQAAAFSGITAGTLFASKDENGVAFNFYNLDYVPLTDGTSQEISIYEASAYVNFDAIPTFDYANQKITIVSDDFDLNSIKVTVTEQIDELTQLTTDWVRQQNVGYVSQINDNIYFVERTSTGFSILFGTPNSLGRSIDTTMSSVIVRYLKTNGSLGNGLSSFSCPALSGSTVLTVSASQGGRNKPDLDSIRFVAPKYFASQERAVTVNDYKALLIEAGYFANDTEFNVFGGQDLTPARFGRVFITTNNPLSDSVIDELINFLKERSIVTVLPEYVTSNTLRVGVDLFYSLGASTQNIASNRLLSTQYVTALFNQYYAANRKYNVNFSASDFITSLQTNTNTIVKTLRISPDNFTIYANEPLAPGKDYTFNLNNELHLPLSSPTPVTDQFSSELPGISTSTTGKKAVLKMFATTLANKNSQLNLQLWAVDTDGTETQVSGTTYGTFIANKGVIIIPSGVINSQTNLKAEFKNKSVIIGLNNLVTLTVNNVTVV